MNHAIRRTVALTALLLAGSRVHAEPPSQAQIKAVWDYFLTAKGQGPILGDARACLEIPKEGEQRFECAKEVGPEGVKAGTDVMVWQAWLVPQGDTVEDVTLRISLNGTIRETKDVSKLKGEGIRTRTWSGAKLGKPGTWKLELMRGDKVFKEIVVKAT